MDKIRVQVCFSQDVEVKGMPISYSDAFYFTQEEYASLSESTLQEMKDDRIANWKNAIENTSAPIEPTEEQLEAEKVAISEQIAQLQSRQSEITAKVSILQGNPIEESLADG
jgi:hypothetical protein